MNYRSIFSHRIFSTASLAKPSNILFLHVISFCLLKECFRDLVAFIISTSSRTVKNGDISREVSKSGATRILQQNYNNSSFLEVVSQLIICAEFLYTIVLTTFLST